METNNISLFESNAVGPTYEITTQRGWEEWLTSSFPDFKGNLGSAANLLFSFNQGKQYVERQFFSKGLKFRKPKIVILTNDNAVPTPIGYVLDREILFIKKSFLEEHSLYDMQAIYTVSRKDKAVVFEGKISDMFALAGVEEAHHAVFQQIKKNKEFVKDPLLQTVSSYDAREVEYRVLEWQLKYAREHKLPKVTIDLLEKRRKEAREVRSKITSLKP